MRLLTLNLNHRTRPKPVGKPVLQAIAALVPDVVVFTEYVEGPARDEFARGLEAVGLPHFATSNLVGSGVGRWHNQVAIASREPVLESVTLTAGLDEASRTNTLAVRIAGIGITGVRVPAYEACPLWYRYWDWLTASLEGDVAIGDFNADPGRAAKSDRVLATLIEKGGWSRPDPDGDWSFRGSNGTQSRVDHVLVRGGLHVRRAWYVQEPFVPKFTDHAALVVDLERS